MSDSEKLRELAELLQRVDAALGRSEVDAALVNTIGYETACNLREDVRNQVENKLTVFLCGPSKCEHDYTGREPIYQNGRIVGESAVCSKCGCTAYDEAQWQ